MKPQKIAERRVRRVKVAASTAPVVHDWPYDEKLTEPEGRMIEALRAWTLAQSDPAKWRELESLAVISDHLYRFRDEGRGLEVSGYENAAAYARFWELEPGEETALRVVADLWQRKVEEGGEGQATAS